MAAVDDLEGGAGLELLPPKKPPPLEPPPRDPPPLGMMNKQFNITKWRPSIEHIYTLFDHNYFLEH